jgi:hypothetical protein
MNDLQDVYENEKLRSAIPSDGRVFVKIGFRGLFDLCSIPKAVDKYVAALVRECSDFGGPKGITLGIFQRKMAGMAIHPGVVPQNL